MKHPIQPTYIDHHGTRRFKPNKIIEHLQSTGVIDLNKIRLGAGICEYDEDDYGQLLQLIGYSVSGYPLANDARDAVDESQPDDDELTVMRKGYDAMCGKLQRLRDALAAPVAELFGKHVDDLLT